MLIHGQLEAYKVGYQQYGHSYCKIAIKAFRRQWYGLKRWTEVHLGAHTHDLEKFEVMYPGAMLQLFTDEVHKYEDYIIQWNAFDAIKESGAKLEVSPD